MPKTNQQKYKNIKRELLWNLERYNAGKPYPKPDSDNYNKAKDGMDAVIYHAIKNQAVCFDFMPLIVPNLLNNNIGKLSISKDMESFIKIVKAPLQLKLNSSLLEKAKIKTNNNVMDYMPYDHVLFRLHENILVYLWAIKRKEGQGIFMEYFIKVEANEEYKSHWAKTNWNEAPKNIKDYWLYHSKESIKVFNPDMGGYNLVYACLAYLKSEEVERIYWPEATELKKINKLRNLRNQKPLEPTILVRLNPKRLEKVDLGGTHASPKEHWRRAHLRLISGHLVHVKETIINKTGKQFDKPNYTSPFEDLKESI